MHTPPAIAFRSVSFSLGTGLQIFSGLNLEIPAGQRWVLAGTSGSGTSFFARLALGLDRSVEDAEDALGRGERPLHHVHLAGNRPQRPEQPGDVRHEHEQRADAQPVLALERPDPAEPEHQPEPEHLAEVHHEPDRVPERHRLHLAGELAPAQVVHPGRELRWQGQPGIRFLFESEHSYMLKETTNGKTHLDHDMVFWGLLIPPVRKLIDKTIRGSFNDLNKALKLRAEGRYS